MNAVMRAISAWEQRPFEFGKTDCCQFCDFVVHELTGKHVIPWAYSDEGEANAILEKHDGLEGAVTSVLGVPSQDMSRGDVVLWNLLDLQGLGIYLGFEKVAVIDAKSGRLHEIPSDYVDASWSCPV